MCDSQDETIKTSNKEDLSGLTNRLKEIAEILKSKLDSDYLNYPAQAIMTVITVGSGVPEVFEATLNTDDDLTIFIGQSLPWYQEKFEKNVESGFQHMQILKEFKPDMVLVAVQEDKVITIVITEEPK